MKTIYGITAPVSEYASALGDVFFTSPDIAQEFCPKAGWYGSDGHVTPVQVFDSVDDYNAWKADETKRNAIKKAASNLSLEERRALGLNF
jgi:hypothetical protein